MRRGIPVVLAAALTLGVAAPARAGTASVSIVSFAFRPATLSVPQGTTVIWTNNASIDHTSTQNGRLRLWNTGHIMPGNSGSKAIDAAGAYPYHCTIHPSMQGVVKVPLVVNRSAGSVGTVFTFTLASTAQAGFTIDVQRKKGKRVWRLFRAGINGRTMRYRAGARGTFRFRSRLHRTSNGARSGWSPAKKIVVS